MSNQAKRIHSLLLTVLIGLSAWGCSGNDSPTGTHQENVGSQAGAENGTGGNEPSVGGSDPGTGGRAVETGGSSTGGSDIPATGGSCGHACTGGSPSGGASPETGGEAGNSGSPDVGGEAGAIEGTGGSDDGGEGGSDPVGTGGEGGASGEPGTDGEAGQETGGASGSSNVGGEAGAIEGTGGSDDGGASGNPATGGEAGSDPGTGGQAGESTGGNSGAETGGAGGEPSGGASGESGATGTGGAAACVEQYDSCVETAECCGDMECVFNECDEVGPRCPIIGDECIGNQCCEGVCTDGVCAMEPLSCDAPVSDAEFAAFEYDRVDAVWASALDDIYVATGQITVGWQGYLPHYDGSSWSEVVLPATYEITNVSAVYGDESGAVWAGGNWNSAGVEPYGVLFTNASGSWEQEVVAPMGIEDEIVRSIWAGDDVVVFSTDVRPSGSQWDANIFIKQSGTWTKMQTPPHEVPFRILKVWGRSDHELYAVGGKLTPGPSTGWDGGVLWYYDGSTWSEVTTLPGDLLHLADVKGNDDGEIFVVGNSTSGAVRLVTTGLDYWEISNVPEHMWETSIATPYFHAAISGGTANSGSDRARVSIMSEGDWDSPSQLGMGINYVNGIQFVPGTDVAILVGTDGTDSGSFFRMTCQ